MAGHDEWIKALIAAWEADTEFAGMLAGKWKIAYHGEPVGDLEYPCITLRIMNEGTVDLEQGWGKFRPIIEINIFSTSPYAALRIHDYMGSNFQIPMQVTAGIQTDGWRIDELIAGPLTAGGIVRVLDGGTRVKEFSADWQGLVIKKP